MDDLEWAIEQIGMRQLEVFFRVADTESFSTAASELDLQQPTVSNHIKQLEELLDSKLIIRENGGGLSLTPLGELCYGKIRSVEAAKNDFEQALCEFFEAERGTIRVGASTIPGEVLLPRVLADFRHRFPDVEVLLEVKDSDRIIDRVREGDLRYGIIGKQFEDAQLTHEPLYRDEMILVGGAEFETATPIDFDQLADLPYVDRLSGSGTREAVEEFFREEAPDAGQRLNRVARLETVQAVKEAVLRGAGVSFLPWSVVYPEVERGELVSLECEFRTVQRMFHGVTNRFMGLSPLLSDFESFLKDTWSERNQSNAE